MSKSLRTLNAKSYDVVVIGGGINGAGIAREAASRGLTTLLVERHDFSSGTTSRSTKLIHGGLRYLEHGELGLVFESLREREVLIRIAPHLVRPIPFIIALYRGDPYRPSQVKLGMMLYDLLSFNKSLPRHRKLSPEDLRELEPGLSHDHLVGAFLYHDAQIVYPERLVVENALSAREHGADMLNHAEVSEIMVDGQAVRGVRVRDRLSGESHELNARVVVNATGPWVDAVCKLLKRDARRRIGGTKGSHLVLSQDRFRLRHALYAAARSDGRPFFIVPWQRAVIIGTTDIRYDGDPDHVKMSDDEINYLLAEANRLVDGQIERRDILYTYSGVRPLPYVPNEPEGKITRRHIICDHEREEKIKGLISIIGGKITTYRNLAEQTVDLVCRKLQKTTTRTYRTDREPLTGGPPARRDEVEEMARQWHVEPSTVAHLYELHGSRYTEVLALVEPDRELSRPVCSHNPDIQAQIIYALKQEMAASLADIFLRRTAIGWSQCLGLDCARSATAVMARYLGWDEQRAQEEVWRYQIELEKTFRILRSDLRIGRS